MVGGSSPADDRAVSEMASVLTLVAIAFVIVFAIGASVLFFEPQTEHPEAAFTFSYFSDQSQLVVTHKGGDRIRAGDLLIRGPDAQATWAELNNNMNDSSMVGANDAISASRQNAYGKRVRAADRVAVVYSNVSRNSTAVLAQWNGTRG